MLLVSSGAETVSYSRGSEERKWQGAGIIIIIMVAYRPVAKR
jgi:hypothetical protein